jgi:hypothetical protein
MSQANVDLILGLIQPGPEVDFVPLFRDDEIWAGLTEALAPHFHPGFEIVARGLPGGEKAYIGVEGMRAAWLEWLVPWETYRAEVERAVDLDERVLLLYRSFGRLEGSAAEVRDELASVWTVSDSKVARVEFLATTHAEALGGVGLSE